MSNVLNGTGNDIGNIRGSVQVEYGKSAYELAVRNGFEGTEKEWLDSLKGIYIGSGEMPVGYNVQIDVDGEEMPNYADAAEISARNAALSETNAKKAAEETSNAIKKEIQAGGYIESLKELNKDEKFSFWVGTQAEYDDLTEKQPFTLYLINDDLTETEIRQLIAKNAKDIANNTTAIAENASAIHSNMLGVHNLSNTFFALENRRITYFFEPPYNSSGIPFGDVSTQGFYMQLQEKDEKLSDHSVVWVDGVLCTVYFRVDKNCYFITGTGTQDTDTSVENCLNLQHIEITVGSTPEVDVYGCNKYLIAKNNCHSYKLSPTGIEIYPKPIQIIRGVY